MWIYNPETELYHYGVKGMKWGVRKKRPTLPVSSTRAKFDAAKAEQKAAKKDYNKDYNRAYGYSNRHMVSQFVSKKHRAESDKRWGDVYDKAERSAKADNAYVKAKRERKSAINRTYADIQSKTTMREKFIYNDATRKKAAQYVVDHNMSVADATKKAKGVAKRNTAIALAAIGAYTVAELKRM